jgi:hypothetical protein
VLEDSGVALVDGSGVLSGADDQPDEPPGSSGGAEGAGGSELFRSGGNIGAESGFEDCDAGAVAVFAFS